MAGDGGEDGEVERAAERRKRGLHGEANRVRTRELHFREAERRDGDAEQRATRVEQLAKARKRGLEVVHQSVDQVLEQTQLRAHVARLLVAVRRSCHLRLDEAPRLLLHRVNIQARHFGESGRVIAAPVFLDCEHERGASAADTAILYSVLYSYPYDRS